MMMVDVRVHVVVVYMMVIVDILRWRSTAILAPVLRINNIYLILLQLSRRVLKVLTLVLLTMLVLIAQIRQAHLRTLIRNGLVVVDLVLVQAVVSIQMWPPLLVRSLIVDWVAGELRFRFSTLVWVQSRLLNVLDSVNLVTLLIIFVKIVV